jgi:hypothetical protein
VGQGVGDEPGPLQGNEGIHGPTLVQPRLSQPDIGHTAHRERGVARRAQQRGRVLEIPRPVTDPPGESGGSSPTCSAPRWHRLKETVMGDAKRIEPFDLETTHLLVGDGRVDRVGGGAEFWHCLASDAGFAARVGQGWVVPAGRSIPTVTRSSTSNVAISAS